MIVGITGGNGFIGSWVKEVLESNGHSVVILDHRGRTGTMIGDVRDATSVHEFASHVDGIIHLAAVLGTAETIDNPIPAAETNILGTLNVFEAACRYKLPVVYAAVGNSGIGRGSYCITKSTGEQFVSMYREDRGLLVTAVRPVNAFGPRQAAPTPYGPSKVRKIVPSFVCAALSGEPLNLYGGGTQVSDSVWVGDVARVFIAALESAAAGRVPDHPVDVGNAVPYTVLDMAHAVANEIGDVDFLPIPMRLGEPEGGPMSTPDQVAGVVNAVLAANNLLRPIDVRRVIKQLGTVVSADVTTMQSVNIDPSSFLPLSEGIRRTVAWFRENRGVTWQYPQATP
jgi:nucleoside-diphosphate-sugar epimerase